MSLPDPGDAPASRVRIGLLDDHEVILDAVASWITANATDFDLVARATRWVDFVRHVEFPVEVVLMDFQLVEPVSIEARIRTCRAAGAKVIVMSALEAPEARNRALAAGALAFIPKSASMGEVMSSVRHALRMPEPVPASLAATAGGESPTPTVRAPLSPGERQALVLYVGGRSTSEVARAMDVKYETAKTYLRRVREKYQRAGRPASRKVELLRRAAEDGYLD